MRHALHRSRSRSDDRHALVRQLAHRRAFGRAARVGIIPATSVEALALEVFDPGQARQLGDMQRAGAHADVVCGEGITAIGADQPDLLRIVPLKVGHTGVEQRVFIEAVMLPDARAMVTDFRGMGVFLARHVPGFFEQRHVDHRCGIALRARIAVPVPGPAEVTALLDDAVILDPRFLQPCADHQSAKAPADEGEGHMVGHRFARDHRVVGIGREVRKLALKPPVLGRAIGAQALVALRSIFAPDRIPVDRRCHVRACQLLSPKSIPHR